MSEPVYFLRLEMENVRCFGEKAELDLSDGNGNWRQWTVILGDNGTGKTTILQVLAGFEQVKMEIYLPESPLSENAEFIPKLFTQVDHINGVKYQIFREGIKEQASGNVGIGFTGGFSSRYMQSINTRGYKVAKDLALQNAIVFGYGANRFMSKSATLESKAENSETLFNDEAKLINAEEWLMQLDYAASKNSDIQQYVEKKREQVKKMLIELLPDVTEIRFTEPTKENLKSSVQFKTELSGWVSIHQLSLGYKTMVAWMVDLAARLFERYPDSDNPLAEPAIVLVDEIDLHMHPKWQRKIFEYLTERFPKTQFVVTAHSPLVVQAAPADANIVLLKKEGDHVVIDNDIESVHNWRLDQIMNSLYGIESTRGPETEKWLAERKGLLQKQELTSGEEERLSELNEKSRSLPTADNAADINAMEIIRKAAEYLQSQKS
jgi:predicted ATP-binding protein involved in virulence